MAFGIEWLQSIVGGDDDSALVVDAHSSRILKLAWLIALRAELEQERAIDRRQYLHSMILVIGDDDSMSIIIDRNARWTVELARLRSLLADREQEREIDQRQEHQSIVVGIGNDDAMMMLVDRNAARVTELEISWSILADARQERLVAQWPWLYSTVVGISDEDAIMIVIDRNAIRMLELAWLLALLAELGHERAIIIAIMIMIIAREHLHSMIEPVNDEQEASMMVERQAHRIVEQAIGSAWLLGADRELDSSITIKSIVSHLSSNPSSHSLTHNDKEIIPIPQSTNRSDDVHEQRAERDTNAREQQEATTNRRRNERTAPPNHIYLNQIQKPYLQSINQSQELLLILLLLILVVDDDRWSISCAGILPIDIDILQEIECVEWEIDCRRSVGIGDWCER